MTTTEQLKATYSKNNSGARQKNVTIPQLTLSLLFTNLIIAISALLRQTHGHVSATWKRKKVWKVVMV